MTRKSLLTSLPLTSHLIQWTLAATIHPLHALKSDSACMVFQGVLRKLLPQYCACYALHLYLSYHGPPGMLTPAGSLRAILGKGPRSRVQWNWAFLFVRAWNWSQGLSTRVQDQGKSNCDYIASFWRENQLVWTKKKELKRRPHGLETQSVS
jgi:hypothetical protein